MIRNAESKKIGINRMIVAYSSPPNLANLLSYRKTANHHDPPVSPYLTRDSDGASFIGPLIQRESKEENKRQMSKRVERERESRRNSN
eukprot:9175966-Ditylum_brightwellii.AAC.1